MADRHCQGVGGMVRSRRLLEAEDRHHHSLHLGLLGAPVAADGLLHARGSVLSALDADVRGRDHDGTSRLADGERGAGVDADERLLEHDGVRRKLRYELLHAVEDRLEAQLGAAPRRRSPAVPLLRLEAASSFVDDSPSARSCARIDTENFHAMTLGTGPDVPAGIAVGAVTPRPFEPEASLATPAGGRPGLAPAAGLTNGCDASI